MIPAPTKTGLWPWRRVRQCYCMAIDSLNPHGWARSFCPPAPMPPREEWEAASGNESLT